MLLRRVLVRPVERLREGLSGGGFSLLEIIVATAVLLLGILLASDLMLRSQIVANRVVAELRDPQPAYAATRLRHDLEGAAAAPAGLFGWQSGRMAVVTGEGERVGWEVVGTTLHRQQLDGAGRVLVAQAVLQDIVGWRWRRTAPRLMDVEIRFRSRDASGTVLVGAPRTWRAAPIEKRRLLRVAIRRGGAL